MAEVIVRDFSKYMDIDPDAIKAYFYLFPISYASTNNTDSGTVNFSSTPDDNTKLNVSVSVSNNIYKFPIVETIDLNNELSLDTEELKFGRRDLKAELSARAAEVGVKAGSEALKALAGPLKGAVDKFRTEDLEKFAAKEAGMAFTDGRKLIFNGTKMRDFNLKLKIYPKDKQGHFQIISYIKEIQEMATPSNSGIPLGDIIAGASKKISKNIPSETFKAFNSFVYQMVYPSMFLGLVVTSVKRYVLRFFSASLMDRLTTSINLEDTFYESDLPATYSVDMNFKELVQPTKETLYWLSFDSYKNELGLDNFDADTSSASEENFETTFTKTLSIL